MKQLGLSSALHKFNSCKEFAEAFGLNEKDLIITCKYIFEPYFGDMDIPAQVIYQEEFGQGEPNDVMINSMIDAIKGDYNRVIGIGGGTVLDISKLFALKNMTPLVDMFQGKIKSEKKCELVLVPTTCGTGSEVTNVAIVGFLSLDTKLRLATDEMYADSAVLIPQLLENLPRHFFATSSIDALIHAIESSLSPLATPYSQLFGHKAIEIIINGYRKIEQEGYEVLGELLENFMIASNYAGIAFGQAGCGAVHAMSYPLSGKYHVAHGEANYALLTSVLKKYAEKECSDKYNSTMSVLKNALQCEENEIVEKLDGLLSVVLEKKPMSVYGTTEDDVEMFADSVLKYQQVIMSHNPTILSKEDVMDIYRDCL
ncbi:MAG: 4-hydroxybutyrate dehydrogenase [Lachnospiraceae bacterium]